MLSKSKVALWMSLFSFFAINLIPTKTGIIFDVVLSIIIALFIWKRKPYDKINRSFFSENIGNTFFSIVVSLLLGIRFFYFWFPSSRLLKLCFNSSMLKNLLLTGATILLVSGCIVILNAILNTLLNKDIQHLTFDHTTESKTDRKNSLIVWIVLITTSILCVTICSKSSPIYPFNNWDDANCFFTVGKSITNNIVMYKDIFEQKGPLLYFIHTLAYLISHTTFIGVYFFELITCFLFLFISYKTLRLFIDSNVIYSIPIIAVIIYSSRALSHGGSAEEFCLPCVALCNYFGIKALKNNENINWKNWLVVGVTSGAVLWIKFSLLGFYIGFGIVFAILYIKKRQIKCLFQAFLSLVIGIVAVSLPILLYFIINNAVFDLFEVYFYDNLFIYTVNSTGNILYNFFDNLYHGFTSFAANYILGIIMIIAGIIYLLLERKRHAILIYCVVTILCTFLLIYSGGRNYQYYSFLFSIYVPFGILLFHSLVRIFTNGIFKIHTKKRYIIIPLGVVIYSSCLIFMFESSANTYMLKYSKEDLPQFKFNEVISQTENPTLLNYGFLDGGFYTVSNIMPNCKYFCGLNIPYNEIKKTQDDFIENEMIDYVVTRGNPLSKSQQVHYKYVRSAVFETTENHYSTYYLYKKVT